MNFFDVNFQNFDTPYLLPERFHDFLDITSPSYFSIVHLNIRSIKKNIENLKLLLTSIIFTFSVICFSEAWLDDLTLSGNNSLNFKIRLALSISNNDIESLSAGIVSDKIRNTIINVLYRAPNGQLEPFQTLLNNTFYQMKISKKAFHIAGDFNLNLLDHDTNKRVQNFFHLVSQNGLIPTINKTARVTKKATMAIDHIFNNGFTETVFKTAIFKGHISDHFLICFLVPSSSKIRKTKQLLFTKEYLTQNQLNHLRNNFMKLIGKKLKPLKFQMKNIFTNVYCLA